MLRRAQNGAQAWGMTPDQAMVQVGICLDGLNLSGHQVAGRTRHKELWALVHLAQEMGKQKESAPLCAQERGILAYQVSLKRPLVQPSA